MSGITLYEHPLSSYAQKVKRLCQTNVAGRARERRGISRRSQPPALTATLV